MRIDAIWKAVLLGTVLVGAGACKDDGDTSTDDTDDTSDTNDDTDVPTEEDDCDDGDDNDQDGDVDCDDSDCASDADCAPEFFDLYAFGVEGWFAYFADTGQVGDATSSGTAVPPYIIIYLWEEDYFTSNYDERYQCTVTLIHDGGPFDLEVWDFTDQYEDSSGNAQTVNLTHAGFSLASWTAETDCIDDKALDEDEWGGDAIALIENASTWGVGIGEARPDVQAILDANYPDDTSLLGGGFRWDLVGDPPYFAPNAGIGYAMDSAGEIQVDGDGYLVPLEAADVIGDGSGVPVTGYYRSIPFAGYLADYLLPQ